MRKATVEKNVFIPSPEAGTAVTASSYYTTSGGMRLLSVHQLISRSDTVDIAYIRRSEDNGASWSEPVAWPTKFENPRGVGRRHYRGGFVDSKTGRYISIWTEGVLPNDGPLEGMRNWTLHYSVSEDGGRSDIVNEQIIHEGDGYDVVNHMPGISVGKNYIMIGDFGCRPLARPDGAILVPAQCGPAAPDGEYRNPGGGYTFHDSAVLIGTWKEGGRLSWRLSGRVVGDVARSTRGFLEGTIAYLADGRLIMVMRGSNDKRPEMPSRRWRSISSDGGLTWSDAQPWTYDDGSLFYSPSSCSQLLEMSDGRLLWIGNISQANCIGNAPRYPIALGEVDKATGLLKRKSLRVIDDRMPGDSYRLTLSNFFAREDRSTHDILLHMSRFYAASKDGGPLDWTADALWYRIKSGSFG